VVTYRITASVPTVESSPPAVESGSPREPELGQLTIGGAGLACRFFWRPALRAGQAFDGPAVVEEESSTTFVPVGWQATVEPSTSLLLRRKGDRNAR
jgi:N-methylhydantoinase A